MTPSGLAKRPGLAFASQSPHGARRRSPIARSQAWGYAAAAPAVLLIVIFFLVPVADMVIHAFTEWDGIEAARFNGLDNFVALLQDGSFITALRNNLLYAAFVPIQVVFALIVAMLIYERTPGWQLFRGIFFLPVVMSPVVIGIVWAMIFNLHGPINVVLAALGIVGPNWLAVPVTSIPSIMIVLLWASFGYNMILYLAGLSTVSPLLIDAAHVDGAGWWATLRHVIAPSLRRTTELVVVLNLISAFAFMLPYIFVMTGGGPGRETFVVELLIYDEGFVFGHVGYASAISLSLFAIVAVLMFAYLRLLRRSSS